MGGTGWAGSRPGSQPLRHINQGELRISPGFLGEHQRSCPWGALLSGRGEMSLHPGKNHTAQGCLLSGIRGTQVEMIAPLGQHKPVALAGSTSQAEGGDGLRA